MSMPPDQHLSDPERFRTLVELSPEALYVVRDEHFIYLNPAAVRLFGATDAAELLGTVVLDRVDPAFHALARSRRQQVLEDVGQAPRTTMRFVRLDGTVIDVEVQATAITFHGHRAIHVAVRDITARLRSEHALRASEERLRQAEKLEAIGRLAGGIAHDFNNAMAVILGHADFALQQLPEGHPVREDLQTIERKAQQSAMLTRQLLAYARKQPIAPRTVDLNVAVPQALELLTRVLGEDITVVWQPADEVWAVAIDPAQLDQICTNLCVNARDAIGGPGTITLSTANCTINASLEGGGTDALPGEYVRLRVQDTGRGMSPEVQARLFEPFFTTKAIGEGTGLGLATVYGIVKQHRGFVAVRSTVGRGTTFDVFLPRSTSEVSEPASPVAMPPATPARGTILLVEDEPSLLRLASRALTSAGYTIVPAEGPTEALERAQRHAGSIDLLLTDVVMPVMSGAELSRRIVAERPGTRVMFMSGYAAELVASHGILDDGVHFLPKPFTLEELSHAVARAMNDETPIAA
ncbi:MAG TPA: ATP-binding protein [Gemmatimonadales bacterium]|nr:ATP-binding protein [Gemmatimonadales bacterium]